MKSKLVVSLCALVFGILLGLLVPRQLCEKPNIEPAIAIPAPPIALLLQDLPNRESWNTEMVKIWLEKPVFVIKHENGLLLEAWPDNENDFNVPMLRVDKGQHLFKLSDMEYTLIRQKGILCRDEAKFSN